jgi:hypothetical protein
LFSSFWRFAHDNVVGLLPQQLKPVLHAGLVPQTHLPALHVSPVPHVLPQAPQFLGSSESVLQPSMQHTSLPLHTPIPLHWQLPFIQ